MKTCDICHEPIGMFNKFRYADGYICKACYKKASRNYTETITTKKLDELKALCSAKKEIEEDFQVTGRIGNYLLVDEPDHKICILNNRMTAGQVSDPEFYSVEEIAECRLICQPAMPLEELEEKVNRREEGSISALKVRIDLQNGRKKEIILISKPVRIKSYAFRQSFTFAKRITDEIHRLMNDDVKME